MIKAIRKLLGIRVKTDYVNLIKHGAIILDVRTQGEYSAGHIAGSINIPLDALSSNLNRLKDTNKPIITCCASSMRSASAKAILLSKGYKEVYNGGGWIYLNNKIGK